MQKIDYTKLRDDDLFCYLTQDHDDKDYSSVVAMNADLRLEDKLKAARTLCEHERIEMKNGTNHFGRFNAGNVELIFNVKE